MVVDNAHSDASVGKIDKPDVSESVNDLGGVVCGVVILQTHRQN